MKVCHFILVVVILVVNIQLISDQNNSPVLLKSPPEWRYERMTFPLDFAPDLKYQGFEELRFAPGMFDRGSPHYFTYVFLIVLRQTKSQSVKLDHFLYQYYRGLCSAVAAQRKIKIDLSKIKVAVKKSLSHPHTFLADLTIIDAFTQGDPINLKMELQFINEQSERDLLIFVLASPQPTSSKIWRELYQIRRNFTESQE